MSADRNILDELGAISPAVAGIGATATYSVPEGYFESFAGKLIARIAAGAGTVSEAGTITGAGIGSGEQTGIGPGLIAVLPAGFRDQLAYQIPIGFFEDFAEKLMRRIKAEEADSPGNELEILSPLLSRLEKKEPFTVPAAYFSDLPGKLVAELQALRFVNDELEQTTESDTLPSVLAGLRDKQTYTLPQGYFGALSADILSEVFAGAARDVEDTGARIVTMQKGSLIKGWMKYAMAACLTGLLVTAGIRIFRHDGGGLAVINSRVGPKTTDTGSLAKVSDQEILNYLENQNEPLADVAANTIAATPDINDSDVKDFLGEVPDAELQQYMDEHGSSKDPLTN